MSQALDFAGGARRLRRSGGLATILFALSAWGGPVIAQAVDGPMVRVPEPAPGPSFEAAMVLYENSHWSRAYVVLAKLADDGDERASQVALLMARHGPSLYGLEFPMTAQQAAAWARRAVAVARREPQG